MKPIYHRLAKIGLLFGCATPFMAIATGTPENATKQSNMQIQLCDTPVQVTIIDPGFPGGKKASNAESCGFAYVESSWTEFSEQDEGKEARQFRQRYKSLYIKKTNGQFAIDLAVVVDDKEVKYHADGIAPDGLQHILPTVSSDNQKAPKFAVIMTERKAIAPSVSILCENQKVIDIANKVAVAASLKLEGTDLLKHASSNITLLFQEIPVRTLLSLLNDSGSEKLALRKFGERHYRFLIPKHWQEIQRLSQQVDNERTKDYFNADSSKLANLWDQILLLIPEQEALNYGSGFVAEMAGKRALLAEVLLDDATAAKFYRKHLSAIQQEQQIDPDPTAVEDAQLKLVSSLIRLGKKEEAREIFQQLKTPSVTTPAASDFKKHLLSLRRAYLAASLSEKAFSALSLPPQPSSVAPADIAMRTYLAAQLYDEGKLTQALPLQLRATGEFLALPEEQQNAELEDFGVFILKNHVKLCLSFHKQEESKFQKELQIFDECVKSQPGGSCPAPIIAYNAADESFMMSCMEKLIDLKHKVLLNFSFKHGYQMPEHLVADPDEPPEN